MIEQNKQRGKYLKNRGHFRLPECEELPRHNKSAKVPTCSYVGLTEINQAEVSCKFSRLFQSIIQSINKIAFTF